MTNAHNIKENNQSEKKSQKNCPECSHKHKDRDPSEIKDLMNRLKRIEGQVRGVEGMVTVLTSSFKFLQFPVP